MFSEARVDKVGAEPLAPLLLNLLSLIQRSQSYTILCLVLPKNSRFRSVQNKFNRTDHRFKHWSQKDWKH